MATTGKVTNLRHIYKEDPKSYPVPGQTTAYSSETIDLDNVSLEGGVLAKVVILSIDPYLRGLMKSGTPGGFVVDEPLASIGLARVIRSDNPSFKVGDHIWSWAFNHEEYTVIPASKLAALNVRVIKRLNEQLPWSVYLGAAGATGLTAYGGWKEIAKAKKGETVFVSTGAGAVGSIVCQIAKLEGLKVIASTGSDDKVKFLKDLGVDVAFNYKTTDTREVLKKAGPIDIYWDHVGGDTTDAALENINEDGRVLVCGLIEGYNSKSYTPIKNYYTVLYKRLTIQGFSVASYLKFEPEFQEWIVPKLISGEIKYALDKRVGLDKAAEAILDVLQGKNVGKSLVVVDETYS